MRNKIQKYYEDLPTLNIVKLYYANFIYIYWYILVERSI